MLNLEPIKIFDASGAKLTVQKTGKLGLSKKAAELLEVTKYSYCIFLRNTSNNIEEDIYMETLEENTKYSLPIKKNGDYYHINGKSLLNEIGIDYTDANTTIIFDLIPIKDEGLGQRSVYKLMKRVLNR